MISHTYWLSVLVLLRPLWVISSETEDDRPPTQGHDLPDDLGYFLQSLL